MEDWLRAHRSGLRLLLIGVPAAVIFIALFVTRDSRPAGDGTASGPDQITICVDARHAVELQLKSPGSAKYPTSCSEQTYRRNEETKSTLVAGEVDSQNGFGALLRSQWVVEVTDAGAAKVISIH